MLIAETKTGRSRQYRTYNIQISYGYISKLHGGLEHKLVPSLEINHPVLPPLLTHGVLEVGKRRLKDVVVVDTINIISQTMFVMSADENVLDGYSVIRFQCTKELDTLLRIHSHHNADAGKRSAS